MVWEHRSSIHQDVKQKASASNAYYTIVAVRSMAYRILGGSHLEMVVQSISFSFDTSYPMVDDTLIVDRPTSLLRRLWHNHWQWYWSINTSILNCYLHQLPMIYLVTSWNFKSSRSRRGFNLCPRLKQSPEQNPSLHAGFSEEETKEKKNHLNIIYFIKHYLLFRLLSYTSSLKLPPTIP